MLRIGVVGYSAQDFDKSEAKKKLLDGLSKITGKYNPNDITIVSGYTALGIPLLAYQIADKRGWNMKGIACEKAKNFETYDVDEVEIIGSDWGDGSQKFLDDIDVLLRVGGGSQSEQEAQEARNQGIPVIEYDL